jgi:hypothetical protein
MSPVGTKIPQEQHIDLSEAADISSSYLPIELRICEAAIPGGNSSEAVSRSLNSYSSKPTARSTASEALVSSVLRFLALGRIRRFADGEGFRRGLEESKIGSKAGTGLGASTGGFAGEVFPLFVGRVEGGVGPKAGTGLGASIGGLLTAKPGAPWISGRRAV